jgi:hypothetical protein
MLRISLFGPPNRRKQPERYVQYGLKFVEYFAKYNKNDLTSDKKLDSLNKTMEKEHRMDNEPLDVLKNFIDCEGELT